MLLNKNKFSNIFIGFFIIFMLFAWNSTAQILMTDSLVNSLCERIKKADGKEKIDLYLKVGELGEKQSTQKIITCLREGIVFAGDEYKDEKVVLMKNLMDAYFSAGKYDSVLAWGKNALDFMGKKEKFLGERISVYSSESAALEKIGKLEEAMKKLDTAIALSQGSESVESVRQYLPAVYSIWPIFYFKRDNIKKLLKNI